MLILLLMLLCHLIITTVLHSSYQVFVRIENSLKVECYSTTEFTINIYTTPTANAVEDLFECDDDNDGVPSFDFAESQKIKFLQDKTPQHSLLHITYLKKMLMLIPMLWLYPISTLILRNKSLYVLRIMLTQVVLTQLHLI